jgi:hypothetical protein
MRPWEFRTVLLPVRMVHARTKGDGDIHLVVADLDDDRSTMVVELPSVRTGQRQTSVRCARAAFVCHFGDPPFGPRWLQLEHRRANLYGSLFFDHPHASGGAPNGIEVHPVIAFSTVWHPSDAHRPDELAALLDGGASEAQAEAPEAL